MGYQSNIKEPANDYLLYDLKKIIPSKTKAWMIPELIAIGWIPDVCLAEDTQLPSRTQIHTHPRRWSRCSAIKLEVLS